MSSVIYAYFLNIFRSAFTGEFLHPLFASLHRWNKEHYPVQFGIVLKEMVREAEVRVKCSAKQCIS